jgi:DNA-binding PadR family transcriptional regulator
MSPVFAHGRLRLYLLKLLDEAPRHGYEVIRLLEERFQGLYAPSAGTVYPRLAKLEAEGRVTHTTEGGRKVYSITESGRAELADREDELADLEIEIRESVSELTTERREEAHGTGGGLWQENGAAGRRARTGEATAESWEGTWGDKEAWRLAREEFRQAKREWKEQARRAREESRRARQEAQRARKQAQDAQACAREEVQRIARKVQEQVQSHAKTGDWQNGLREGMAELARQMSGLGRIAAQTSPWPPYVQPEPAGARTPEWTGEPGTPSTDPVRDLERLLDRFRDDIRDAARDHGVSEEQLREVRRHLSTATAHIGAVLRHPDSSG